MSGAHTPGPWNIAQDIHNGRIGICSEQGVVVFAPHIRGGIQLAGVQRIEDARLISAAPDLLEAAKTVMAGLLQRIHDAKEVTPVFAGIAALDAAIAKAEGR